MATQDKLDGLIDLHRARLIESLYLLENGIIDAIALADPPANIATKALLLSTCCLIFNTSV